MIEGITLDNEAFRFVLVASIAVAFLVYTRFRLVAGGSVTGGFIAGLALFGQWEVVLWVAGLAFASALAMRVVILRYLPLSRSLVFQGCVLVGALIGIGIVLVVDPFTDGIHRASWSLIVAYGALVTPGLTAYDLMHQGTRKTALAIGAVAVGTLALTVPVIAIAERLPDGISGLAGGRDLITLDARTLWLATVAAVALGAALRLSAGLRSGGFLGALFLAELATWEAIATVGAGAVTAALAMRVVSRHVVLTPRQAAQVALIGGALVAWAGLYWLSAAGWDPAIAANALRVSPLLAVGLIAADMGRADSSIPRTLVGVAVATALIIAVVGVAEAAGIAAGALVLLAAVVAIGLPGALRLRRSWAWAIASARTVALREPRPAITAGAPVAAIAGLPAPPRAAEAIERRAPEPD